MTTTRPLPLDQADLKETQLLAMIEYLRTALLLPENRAEKCHAIFLDHRQAYLGEASMGRGGPWTLSVRMRDIFAKALQLSAKGIVIAHNHPSGYCRPSPCDIAATKRLGEIARALDIVLIDHLIITRRAFYSMRAGGHL